MLLQRPLHTIKPLTTAHLAQTMTLLELNIADLGQKVERELAANPALEMVESRRCPICRRALAHPGPCPVCSQLPSAAPDQPIVFLSPQEDFHAAQRLASHDDLPDDNLAPEVEDLPHFVLSQIAAELAPEDRGLAAHILTSLDEDGLLRLPLTEIARYHHVPLERVAAVRRLIQHAEPLGVGSSNPQEALLVQLEALAETTVVSNLAVTAIAQGFLLLSRCRYAELGALLGISTTEAKRLANFIGQNLNPFPARAHWGSTGQPAAPTGAYHIPDMIFTRLNSGVDSPLVVEVALPFCGQLQINP
jgi:RNA polymerase sigma-54 factor